MILILFVEINDDFNIQNERSKQAEKMYVFTLFN